MAIELKVPSFGESITEVEIGEWLKREGDAVGKDENIVSIESEKATVDLPAPAAGILAKILKKKGEPAKVGETIGLLEATRSDPAATEKKSAELPGAPPAAPAQREAAEKPADTVSAPGSKREKPFVMPAAQRALEERGLSPEAVTATGPGGRLLKEDVLRPGENKPKADMPAKATAVTPKSDTSAFPREEELVPMTPLRRKMAARLLEAQHNAALLTTVNEIDMSEVMSLRKEFGEVFQNRNGVKLGLMSFFIKATIEALRQSPDLNAEVRGTEIVYRNYYDIGVAVGGGKGLVVPVLRNAERLSFAEVEAAIGDFARRAKENKLLPQELLGGTFTISNGGVYGSLLSTPIVNPPQSGVLGMHTIQDRPVARDGSVVIRPMMYVALTYDHRIVDGRAAVTCLKRIKEIIEKPARMLLEV
ncbi:MAG: 2-oxoglutarate dehydrogenase complex dihydrolipoyllysine-residue succinyltransferase [Verrucomicrobiota bacterium]